MALLDRPDPNQDLARPALIASWSKPQNVRTAASYTTGAGRHRIVLAATEGRANAAIARQLGICVDTVCKWRARFCAEGLAGLADRPRLGRQRTFPAPAEAEVKALACAVPAEAGVPLARWSAAELAAEAVSRRTTGCSVHVFPFVVLWE